MTQGRCRDCGATRGDVGYFEWGRRSGPKCLRCGGLLDRINYRKPYARTMGRVLVHASAASRKGGRR